MNYINSPFETIYTDKDTDINVLCEDIENIVGQMFEEENRITYEQLKTIAQNFSSIYTNENYNLKSLIEQAQLTSKKYKLSKAQKNVKPETLKKRREERAKANFLISNAYKTLYANMVIFVQAFNSYMGKTPSVLTFVYSSQNGNPTVYTLPLSRILQLTYQGKFTGSLTTYTKIETIFEQVGIEKIDSSKAEPHPYAAYMGSYNRLEKFYELRRKYSGNPKEQKQGGYLMWKIGRDWFKGFVLNYGDLKEAYVAALVENPCKLKADIGIPKYYSHELIRDFYNNYVVNVDNTGAAWQEDVEDDKFQYAVKSVGAQLPHLHQFYKLAQSIIGGEHSLSNLIESTKQEIKENQGQRNKLVEVLNGTAKQAADEIIRNNMFG